MYGSRIKLKPRNLVVIKNFASVTILWIALMYSYIYFTFWSMSDLMKIDIFMDYLDSILIHIEILVQGIVFGILFGLVNYLTDNTVIHKKSFGALILIKSTLYLVAIIISMISVYAFYYVFKILPMGVITEMQSKLPLSYVISLIIYIILTVIFINFITQVNRKFGHGVLFHMFLGTYHKPRKERRIFMFLDLKNSTGLAKNLGHYNYSRFIQSCIHDLTDLIIRYKAEVYQYVGDEIVLTWHVKSGLKDLNCINLFYAFEQKLNDKNDYYQTTFTCTPEFKAGLDMGVITVTEVGDIKREIAYHGDVLNTASRLEKLCNQLNRSVLISDRLYKYLPQPEFYNKELVGEYRLRGKDQKEKVYGVERVSFV